MATTLTTPGVYIEEVSIFPPSVAEVATAIPAFTGLTQKAEKDSLTLINIPTRITSILEFELYFGGEKELIPGDITIILDEENDYAVQKISISNNAASYLYNSVRLFFDNGGGACLIVSTGLYKNLNGAVESVSLEGLTNSLQAASMVDDITLLVMPDAVLLEENNFYQLQQLALQQCNTLQDRFAILDLLENKNNSLHDAANNFRQHIGMNNLKYGAAYTPWLYHSYPIPISFYIFSNYCFKKDGITPVDWNLIISNYQRVFKVLSKAVKDGKMVADILEATSDATNTGSIPLKAAFPLKAASASERFNQFSSALLKANKKNAPKRLNALINFVHNLALRFTKIKFSNPFLNDLLLDEVRFEWRNAVSCLIAMEKNLSVKQITGSTDEQVNALYNKISTVAQWLHMEATNIPAEELNYAIDDTGNPLDFSVCLVNIDTAIRSIFQALLLFAETISHAANKNLWQLENDLYQNYPALNNIVSTVQKELSKIPPSGAVAGIYAKTDNERGVWKAPANVSINSITGPAITINDSTQENLNVDVNEGKSINTIRTFTGKGTLVWGARTLAGNDNEWRYISVKRFFNMVEESCKKATSFAVFEPNDANTWLKVQAMIENFLIVQWRNGALQGAKPEHAFYVAIGLNKTMTAQDIIEGRMIVEIGMAVIRPAEFVILRFSHAMQTT